MGAENGNLTTGQSPSTPISEGGFVFLCAFVLLANFVHHNISFNYSRTLKNISRYDL